MTMNDSQVSKAVKAKIGPQSKPIQTSETERLGNVARKRQLTGHGCFQVFEWGSKSNGVAWIARPHRLFDWLGYVLVLKYGSTHHVVTPQSLGKMLELHQERGLGFCQRPKREGPFLHVSIFLL